MAEISNPGARVRVVFLASLYEASGRRREVEVEVPSGTTVVELAKLLEDLIPGLRGRLVEGDSIAEGVEVLVNGRNIEWLDGPATKLRGGEVVVFFPPAAGG